jgi:FKBP-type peptidyl-prolyl cis-trans isomerase SlyD
MKITKNSVVTVDYSVVDAEGNLIDEGAQPIVYLHGGYDGGLFPKIENALDGKEVGYSVDVELAPEDAFGDYEGELVEVEERSAFPADLAIGMQFERGEGDETDSLLYMVTDIADDRVTLDANHPLAGLVLKFSCTVTGVRSATPEELKEKAAIQ